MRQFPYLIDWGMVSQRYSGFEIPCYDDINVQEIRRNRWLYLWDIPSGVIWIIYILISSLACALLVETSSGILTFLLFNTCVAIAPETSSTEKIPSTLLLSNIVLIRSIKLILSSLTDTINQNRSN